MFDEQNVITAVLSGNLRAFEALVKQYEQLVFYIVNRMVTDKDDKADISQEVFIKVYQQISKFEYKSKLSTWIARIAYHTTLNYIRDQKRERLTEYPHDIENFHFTTETPERLLDKKELSIYINELIEKLPLQLRTVLTLYHLNEFSYQEIEDITGMPEGTVKSYLFRARKLLKEKIEINLKNEQIRSQR
jgi:RNA polymerase sigma-70 factor (ECF subfamily)